MRFQRRQRTTFSRQQLDALKEAFKATHYPDAEYRDLLAKTTNLDPSRIQVWFQNQRAKVKKSKGPDDNNSDCYSPPSFELGRDHHNHQRHNHNLIDDHNYHHHEQQQQQQQQNTHRKPFRKQSVYIFSSTIANEAALAVSEGKFSSIIEFHKNKHKYPIDAHYN